MPDGERGSCYHFAMSGKSYQVIFQHFNSLLPKVSTWRNDVFSFTPQISEIKKGKRTVKAMITEVILELRLS